MGREVVALLLAGVLATAGAAKLLDPGRTRRSVLELGLPSVLGWPAAIALPPVELVLAVGLVVEATSRTAASAAAGLLAAFAAVVGVNAFRGRKVDCGCFGPLHAATAGWPSAARNGALAALALALAGSAAAPVEWRELAAALVVAFVAAQATAWVVILRRYGRALRRIDELEAEAELPPDHDHNRETVADVRGLELQGLDGAPLVLADVTAGPRPTVLVVTDERCGACTALYPEVARWQRELRNDVAVVVVGGGSPERLRALAEEHELDGVLVSDRVALAAHGIYGAPSALLIDGAGRIASPVRYGGLDIEALVLDAANSGALEVSHHG